MNQNVLLGRLPIKQFLLSQLSIINASVSEVFIPTDLIFGTNYHLTLEMKNCFQLLRIFLVHLITVWQQLFFLPRRLLAEMMLFPILLFLASGEELHSCVLFCWDNHLLRFCFCVVIFWVLLPIKYQCLFAVAFRKLAIERQSI